LILGADAVPLGEAAIANPFGLTGPPIGTGPPRPPVTIDELRASALKHPPFAGHLDPTLAEYIRAFSGFVAD
jgi:hypothetical protein